MIDSPVIRHVRQARASTVKEERKDMTVKRMDNVHIVVDDLEATKAFFIELGFSSRERRQSKDLWSGD